MQHFVAFIWVFTVCQSTHSVKWLNIHVQLFIVAHDEGGGGGGQAEKLWQDQTESTGLANSM